MTIDNFKGLKAHLHHHVEVVQYGDDNMVVECLTCNEILYEEFAEEDEC